MPFARYRSRARWAPIAVLLGLVLAGGAAYLAFDSSALGRTHKPRPRPVLSASVAVLNAGDQPHAAHRLALVLAHRHVHIVGVGNLGAPAPASYEVLYRTGDAGQARLLARVMKAHHPLVAPISAATAHAIAAARTQAIDSTPELVVVIP